MIDEDGCQQISQDMGTYLLTQMAELQKEFDMIGDVRGKGLMTGLELVVSQVEEWSLNMYGST